MAILDCLEALQGRVIRIVALAFNIGGYEFLVAFGQVLDRLDFAFVVQQQYHGVHVLRKLAQEIDLHVGFSLYVYIFNIG